MTQPQSGFAIGNVVLRLVKDIPVYRHIEPIIGEIERRAILASTKTVLTTGVTSDTVSGYLPLPITHTRPDCRNYWESRISALSLGKIRRAPYVFPTLLVRSSLTLSGGGPSSAEYREHVCSYVFAEQNEKTFLVSEVI